MKREFITWWSKENVSPVAYNEDQRLTEDQRRFFNGTPNYPTQAILPDIPYTTLLGFIGKKTKVTIEVIE